MSEQLSLLPPVLFWSLLPPHIGSIEQALYNLMEGNLAQIDWIADRNLWRLSPAVKSLNSLGWEPKSIMVQHPAWISAIARYSLPLKPKQAACTMRKQGGAHD